MATAFIRSVRALSDDAPGRALVGLAVVVVLTGMWGLWFFLAPVTLHAVSVAARIEAQSAAHPVAAAAKGRVAESRLRLGCEVAAGDVLLVLDDEGERQALAQAHAELGALEPRIAALRDELQAVLEGGVASGAAALLRLEEARARLSEAEADERLAADERARLEALVAQGLAPTRELARARADAERRAASVRAVRASEERLEPDGRVDRSERAARVDRLRGELGALEGELDAARAARARVEAALARRAVRAPVAGRLAEVAPLEAGSWVEEGDRLAVIVPPSRQRVVAQFEPAAALGRIRAGQSARFLLDGFPWTQYGALRATVSEVAGEVRDGRVRVELALDEASLPAAIPLQHGLPGVAEIAVERTSPATFALRSAGWALSARGAAASR